MHLYPCIQTAQRIFDSLFPLAVVFLCLAAVILPAGFHMAEIGSVAYQLPPSYSVGVSYIMFIVSIFVTGAAELCACRLCLSHHR